MGGDARGGAIPIIECDCVCRLVPLRVDRYHHGNLQLLDERRMQGDADEATAKERVQKREEKRSQTTAHPIPFPPSSLRRESKSDPPGVFDEPSHLFSRDGMRRDDQITFILSILVIEYNDKFAGLDICHRFIDRVELRITGSSSSR